MAQLKFLASREDEYPIIIEAGILEQIGSQIRHLSPTVEQVVVVTDRNVYGLYGKILEESLNRGNFKNDLFLVEPGEQSKSLRVASHLWKRLSELLFRRRSLIIAFGGGVVTDLAGFVAAGYMRGVPYLNVPTTLVAQLDAAIGSKVAVNHGTAKNLIGFFHHPIAVYGDPIVLTTLPARELRQGFAEAIKVAIVGCGRLFEFIENHAQDLLKIDVDLIEVLILLAVTTKIRFLKQDVYEHEICRALNFGHAIGHALETVSAYQEITHGDAVSIGIGTATRIAKSRGLLDDETAWRILKLLERIGLPSAAPDNVDIERVWRALSIIRAIRDGHFSEVLPKSIGDYEFTDELTKVDLRQHMLFGIM